MDTTQYTIHKVMPIFDSSIVFLALRSQNLQKQVAALDRNKLEVPEVGQIIGNCVMCNEESESSGYYTLHSYKTIVDK